MVFRRIALASLISLAFAAGALAPSGTAQASTNGLTTECAPYKVGRVWHQQCTVYENGPDGDRWVVSVYYIDEFGVPYVI
ncbi:MAG: hypothetical protein GAK31_00827 [Stenotrophomonas maltophilia]|uniref:Secreted protein n=1 Tax=Stenotrophomonas maltophilia TaxID=40324 RepID=A0A7V8FK88_STEMA|nr:MAG: hypothetical protein GAK31_00827 [Stenotrophomonas maltophilia]